MRFVFLALTLVLSGCKNTDSLRQRSSNVTTKTASTSEPHFRKPELAEVEALEIGKRFAEEKKWQLRDVPKHANYFGGKGEWQILFKIVRIGGPYIVYVNDRTKATRFIKGE